MMVVVEMKCSYLGCGEESRHVLGVALDIRLPGVFGLLLDNDGGGGDLLLDLDLGALRGGDGGGAVVAALGEEGEQGVAAAGGRGLGRLLLRGLGRFPG